MMIANDQQAAQARRVVQQYADQLRALDTDPRSDPDLRAIERSRLSNMRAMIQRAIAMWEAGIREPVPCHIQFTPPSTSDQYNAATGEDEARIERETTIAYKQAEIANIDLAITLLQHGTPNAADAERIADWRRHKAWLEREIAELMAVKQAASR